MIVLKIPSDRLQAFENRFITYDNAFGTYTMRNLFSDIRYGLFQQGYKIDSIVTVYYLLFYVFGGEFDASRWNICFPTEIIIKKMEYKIDKLISSNKLISFQA